MEKLATEEIIRPDVAQYVLAKKLPLVLVLDNIRSMSNVGSLFRSSDAFAVEKIILCGITGTPPHKEIHRTALGATESVVWEYEKETEAAVKKLKSEGWLACAVEQVRGSILLNEFETESDKKYALILGNEVFGVSQGVIDICDFALEIPQLGTKHSLNVAVCGGIALWKFYEKLSVR